MWEAMGPDPALQKRKEEANKNALATKALTQ
jgi:hypothetical protein